MTPNNSARSNPSPHPMNNPHIPITEAEMNPNMKNEKPKSGINILLTMFSFLILACVVGITLYLYIQNRNTNQENNNAAINSETLNSTQRTLQLVKQTSFKNIEDAIKEDPSTFTTLEVTDTDEKAIAESIGKFTNLTEVFLPRNGLTSIPDYILEMNQLTSLWLPANEIESIPAKISNLNQLQVLNLTSNKLESLPKEIGELAELEELILSSNFIEAIPDEIKNLTKLKVLVLHGNFISNAEKARIIKLLPNTKVSIDNQRDPKKLEQSSN